MDAVATAKEKMTKTISVLERDLGTLKAGRANPQALDRIFVDYYGSPMPINQLGNISSPEARLLVISPYDANMIKDIEKAIQKSDLGINPNNDGRVIRLACASTGTRSRSANRWHTPTRSARVLLRNRS